MKDRIKVLIANVDSFTIQNEYVEDTVEAFQELVGGYFEAIYPNSNGAILVNEEGRLRRLPLNFHSPDCLDEPICGNFIIVGRCNDGFTNWHETLTVDDLQVMLRKEDAMKVLRSIGL